ncbi:hypothetical protein TNCV_3453991 [Trichonephila clavipes]|nr:hypothetical protein TNCV_3453991 [Trichonephila clavipes]
MSNVFVPDITANEFLHFGQKFVVFSQAPDYAFLSSAALYVWFEPRSRCWKTELEPQVHLLENDCELRFQLFKTFDMAAFERFVVFEIEAPAERVPTRCRF